MELVLALRSCSNCEHWSRYGTAHKDGYVESVCTEPKDSRDQEFKRGGDKCSHWCKR